MTLKKNLAALLTALTFSATAFAQDAIVWKSSSEPLSAMEKVRQQIKAPVFRKKDFPITDYGAKGDGVTNNSEAFSRAIEACNKDGGGRVTVPFGVFLTGPIYLKSNVNLHLADSAKILFSRDTKEYPIVFTRWEGTECMNYSAQIYAYGEENIAVTGHGILDGNADRQHWWNWVYDRPTGGPTQDAARTRLRAMMRENTDPKTRVFGEGSNLRPNMLQPYNCKNVLIADVKLVNSPMWFMNPVLCENVTIDGVRVISHGPNNDGCDPESCKNVLIKNCLFDTGDDCIAIKSGRDEDGRRIGRPAENHIIENCEMKDGHGGVTIGSEIAGGARNIYAINCIMDSPNLDRVLRLKTSSLRGGVIENVFMKDVKVGTFKEAAISADMFYESPGNFIPTIRNVWVENLTVSKGGNYGIYVRAYEASPVKDLQVINSAINGVKTPMRIDHVADLRFRNATINGEPAKWPQPAAEK
jgi:polygalacturonase